MTLSKKVLRQMHRHKKAYISCFLLVAVGVWAYATMNTALYQIEEGKNRYYKEQRLADVFASVSAFPKNDLDSLTSIPGIEQVNGRLVADARVVTDDQYTRTNDSSQTSVLKLHLVSTIIGDNDERLNAYVPLNKDLENYSDILIGKDFYDAWLEDHDTSIKLLVSGQTQTFKIKGSLYSPEYVYVVEDGQELFSDTTTYNVAYVSEEQLMSMLDMEGAYNDLSFTLQDGYTYTQVEAYLKEALEPYGLTQLYPLKDLFSYNTLEGEITGGKSMSTSFPLVFILMASAVLYLMLKRLIEQEHRQLGMLSAFGYSRHTLLIHYVTYGLLTGLIGGLIGILLSLMTTKPYINLYLDYYKLPIESHITYYSYYIQALFFSLILGGLGALLGASKLFHLSPAQAMRSNSTNIHVPKQANTFPFIHHILNSRGIMAFRNMRRNLFRSSFIVLGVVFSYGLLVMISMMGDVIDDVMRQQFQKILKYDVKISVDGLYPYNLLLNDASQLPNVEKLEAILQLPVTLEYRHKNATALWMGLSQGTSLYKLYDRSIDQDLIVSDQGLIMSKSLAQKLDIGIGDNLTLISPYSDHDLTFNVLKLIDQSVGAYVYMDIDTMSEALGSDTLANTILLKTQTPSIIKNTLFDSQQVTAIENLQEIQDTYYELFASYDTLLIILRIVATVIAFTIIYNTAIISLTERSHEYATLRIIGLQVYEIKEILSIEYSFLTLLGIGLGIPFSNLLNQSLASMVNLDTFSWPSSIGKVHYLLAAFFCLVAVYLSNYTTSRAIYHLDLVDVLKERE